MLTQRPSDHRVTGAMADSPYDPDAVQDSAANAFYEQQSRKKRAAAVQVPTSDDQVRQKLRSIGEPITLFGEGRAERRDRLRELLTDQQDALDADGDVVLPDVSEEKQDGGVDDNQEEFYTEGSQELLDARQDIARFSLRRARRKIEYQKAEHSIPLRTHVKHRNEIKEKIKGYGGDQTYSQIAADRPVSIVRFSPNGEYVAAGNWVGSVKLMDVPNLTTQRTWKGHTDRVGGIGWYPGATLPGSGVESGSVNLASGGGEGKIQLWSLESDTPLSTLSGHSGRVCRTEFHPSGKYLASASFDTTWRLWDVNTSTELLLEEGHSREVYTVNFNGDGSLLASAGLDSIGRVWDLRTGRTIMILEGHTKEIYGMDWSPDGYRILTGSGDGLAICWDVRMVRDIARIPAHSRGVTDLRWFKGTDGLDVVRDEKGDVVPKNSGTFVVSCGFDQKVKIFSANDWTPCNTLSGHSGNVLSTDVTLDGKWIASCGHDRTVKLWGREDELPI